MKHIVEKLFELQTLLLAKPADGSVEAAKARYLRGEAPAGLLGYFDRRLARGRRAVAVVRHGVCNECHMRLPTAVAAGLANTGQLVICEICGCYLMMAPDELESSRRQIEEVKAERLKKIRRAASTLV